MLKNFADPEAQATIAPPPSQPQRPANAFLAYYRVQEYDDLSWVESWCLPPVGLAIIRLLFAAEVLVALYYAIYSSAVNEGISKFVFYLTHLSSISIVVYLGSMAVLGFRDQWVRLNPKQCHGWSGWVMHQLYVLNFCFHLVIPVVYWGFIVEARRIDTWAKLWLQVSVHAVPLAAMLVEFVLSKRTLVAEADWTVTVGCMAAYMIWMWLAALLHPKGSRDGGRWWPYRIFSLDKPENIRFYFGTLAGLVVVFVGVYWLHRLKVRLMASRKP